jgi:hypothetical protein
MSILRFSDGQSFDTDGELRVEEREDGFYVVGKGLLVPVKDKEEGELYIKKIEGGSHEKKEY